MYKVFVRGLIFGVGAVCLHGTPLECKKGHSLFYRYVAPLEQRGLFTDEDFFTTVNRCSRGFIRGHGIQAGFVRIPQGFRVGAGSVRNAAPPLSPLI